MKKRIFIGFGSILLSAVVVLAIVLGVVAARKKDTAKSDPVETPSQGGGMYIEDETTSSGSSQIAFVTVIVPSNEYAEYGISSTALNAVQIQATITPPEAENNKLDWELYWESGTDGTWGEGKTVTEYVSGSASDDTLTYTLECAQAFAEKIIVKASIRGNREISKTREIGCLQGYADLSAKVTYGCGDAQYNLDWDLSGETSTVRFAGGAKTSVTFTNYYGESGVGTTSFTLTTGLSEIYTVPAEVGEVKAEISAKPAYSTAATNAYGKLSAQPDTYVTLGTASGQSAKIETSIAKLLFLDDMGELEFAPFKYNVKVLSPAVLLTLRLSTTVNGHAHSKEIGIMFDAESFGMFASGLEFDDDSPIIFETE